MKRFVFLPAVFLAISPFCHAQTADDGVHANQPVTIGVGPILPPLLERDADGRLSGFVIDFLAEAARRMSVRIEFVLVPDVQALHALNPDKVPLVSWLLSDELGSGYVRFERSYLTLHSAVFRRSEPSNDHEIEATELGEIIAVEGSEAHHNLLDDGAITIHTVPTIDEAVLLLASGAYDSLFANEMGALDAIRRLEADSIVEVPSRDMHMHQRIALMRSQARPDLEALLAPALHSMRHDGAFDLAYAHWFGPLEEASVSRRVFTVTVGTVALGGLLLGLVLFMSRRRLLALVRGQGEALRESESRLGDILGDVDAIIWEATPQGRFTYVSSFAVPMLGYPIEKWLEVNFFPDVLLHPEDRDKAIRACQEATEHGEDHRLDYRANSASGAVVWIDDMVRVVKDEAGKPVKLRGVMVDVTKRRVAEEAVHASDAQLAAIMAASPTGIFRLDTEGRVTFGNQESARITGIDSGPIDLRRWLKAIHPDDRDAVTAAWRRVTEEILPDHREYRFVHPDGEVVWVLDRGVPERDITGRITGFVGTLTDITLIKKNEETIRTHSKVLMSMTEGVNTTDEDGTILYSNAAFDAMFGYAPGELIGKNVSILNHLPSSQFGRRSDTIVAALREHGTWIGEFRNRRKDGSDFWTRARLSRLDGAGNAFGVCVQEDITESKRAQEALRASEEKFRRIADSALVGIAIHDETRYTYLNEASRRLLGYSPEDFDGMTWMEQAKISIAAHDIPRITEAFQRMDAAGFVDTEALEDVCLIHRDGSLRWATLFFGRLFPDRPYPRLTVSVDTTERMRAQQARAESEEKFRRVAETALVGIALFDGDRFTFSNDAMVAFIGYTPEELSGLGREKLMRLLAGEGPHDTMIAALSRLDTADGSTDPAIFDDIRLRHRDGTDRWARLTVSRLFPDKPFPRLFICAETTARRRAEEALRQSEEKFRRIAESALVGIALHDGTRYTFINEAMLRIFGQQDDSEAEGLNREGLANFFFTETEGHRILDALRQLDEQGEDIKPVVLDDVCLRYPDGKPHWANVMVSRLYPYALYPRVTLCVDTTERKRTEEMLRKHQDMLRRTQDMAKIGGWEFDVDAGEIACSDEVRSIYGLGPDVHMTWDMLLSHFGPEDQPMIHERGARAVIDQAPFSFEAELVNAQGRRVWVHVSAETVVENGRVVRVVGAVQDVSDLKRVENSLRESEALFRAFAEQMPDSLLLLDLDDPQTPGRILYANPAAARMHGMRLEEIVGIPITKLDTLDTAQHAAERIHRMRKGETIYFEGEHRRKDGSVFPVDVVARAIPALGGNKVLAIDRDITERRKAEEERRRIEARMQHAQKLESLGVLTGGIAHDFNNLLAGILGHADLALVDAPVTGPVRESIEQIEVAARRASDLVHQMLAYSGRGNFVVRRVQLGEMVRELSKLLEVTLSKKAALRFELDDTAPPIDADAAQIQQVVMNLITNASDALGDRPGTITLRSGTVEYTEEALRAYAPHEPPHPGLFVFLEVSDTGCGMDAATLDRIFDPFFSTKFTGRGLGLAAALGIIRGHHGGLRVTSSVGRGTTFRVIFPAATGQEPVAAKPAPETSRVTGRAGTFLIVDDEPRVRDFLVRALQRFGHDTLVAGDGRQALDVFDRHKDRIDAVLLDITMPEMGGGDVLRALHARRPDLPVMLMSGFTEAETRNQLEHNGYAGFLQKPFSLETLRIAVDGLLVGK